MGQTYFTILISEDVPEGVDSRPRRAQIVNDSLNSSDKRSTTTTYSFISRTEAAPMEPPLSGSAIRRSSSGAPVAISLGNSASRRNSTPLACRSTNTSATYSQDKNASKRSTTTLTDSGRSPAPRPPHVLSGRGNPRFVKPLPGGGRSSADSIQPPNGRRPTHGQSAGGIPSTSRMSHDKPGTNANHRIISPIPVNAGRSVATPMQRPRSGSASRRSSSAALIPNPLSNSATRRTNTPLAGGSRSPTESSMQNPIDAGTTSRQLQPYRRSPERIVTIPVLNNSRRDDPVLRAMFEMNENFNTLNRKVDQISMRIDTHQPREEYDPMEELPVKTLEELRFVCSKNYGCTV